MRHSEITCKTTRVKPQNRGDHNERRLRIFSCEKLRSIGLSCEALRRNAENAALQSGHTNANLAKYCTQILGASAYNPQSGTNCLDVGRFVTTIERCCARVSKILFRGIGRFTGASSENDNAFIPDRLNADSDVTANKALAEQTPFAFLRSALYPRYLFLIRNTQLRLLRDARSAQTMAGHDVELNFVN